jgi:hypothetical protein
MTGPEPATVAFYRPAEVARMLRCSEWWVKEQARQRRIPYSWIGGSYLFTAEHVAEIIRRFEVRPEPVADTVPAVVPARRARASDPDSGGDLVQLRARTPRRSRSAA